MKYWHILSASVASSWKHETHTHPQIPASSACVRYNVRLSLVNRQSIVIEKLLLLTYYLPVSACSLLVEWNERDSRVSLLVPSNRVSISPSDFRRVTNRAVCDVEIIADAA